MKAFWTGAYTETGKLDLVLMPSTAGDLLNVGFVQSRGKRVTPLAPLVRVGMNTYIKDPLAVPCGHCVGCRMDRAKAWKVRNVHESELYPRNDVNFLTLTYDNEHLPVDDNGVPVLVPSDISAFMKRLRAGEYGSGESRSFRFFSCGEYGEHGHRPHYHMILYGHLDDLRLTGFKSFSSDTVDKAWRKGITEVKPIDTGLISYCCGYVEKKQCDPYWNEYPVKPFLKMSTRPGIGSHYSSRINGSRDRKVYGNFGKFHYAGIPRAYLKPHENEPWYAAFKEDSIAIAKQALINNLGAVGSADEEVLGDVMEEALLTQLDNLRRTTL